MKKLFPKFLFFTILFLIFPARSFAQVSQIVFITNPQSVAPNVLSGPITIQTQDSNGNAFQTPEKIDLQFISTSPTGQFLNSAGNPVSTYMSTNTANRTFYYKDSTEGAFTITLNTRGKDTGTELSVSQQITISANASQDGNPNPSGEVLGASNDSSIPSDNSSSSNPPSSGGSTTNVSSLNAQLEILAGNDRTTSPGSPIWFQATVKKNTTGTGPELNWSFGDGNVGVGPLVSHTYKYPGDYVVVLSAGAGDIFSVSRLKVKVVESNISVRDMNEYLEISNNGNAEINLFNWKVENGGKGFVFQPNTIILPHSSIKLEKNLLTMKGLDNSLGTCLKNSFGKEVFALAPVKEVNLSEVSKNIDNIKKEALIIQSKIPNTKVSLENLSQIATGTENIIYEVPKKPGILSRAWHFLTSMLH
jgi:hypothetical protein